MKAYVLISGRRESRAGDSLTDGRERAARASFHSIHSRPSPSSFTVAVRDGPSTSASVRRRWPLTRAKKIACIAGRGGSADLCPSLSLSHSLSLTRLSPTSYPRLSVRRSCANVDIKIDNELTRAADRPSDARARAASSSPLGEILAIPGTMEGRANIVDALGRNENAIKHHREWSHLANGRGRRRAVAPPFPIKQCHGGWGANQESKSVKPKMRMSLHLTSRRSLDSCHA